MKQVFGIICSAAVVCLILAGCGGKNQRFTIEGEIEGGEGKVVYLENVGTAKIVAVDSLRLKSDHFRFRRMRPDYPDFYRLRLDNQVINLAIDSTESIRIQTDTARFSKDYTLEGDVNASQKLKELTLLQNNTALRYRGLQKEYEEGRLSMDQYIKEAGDAIGAYKAVARDYIFVDFLALPAYFALFQQINNLFIFDMYDKDDNKLFGAVANSWNTTYPNSPRAIQLKNIFTGSRATIRREQRPLEVQEADSKALFDITLPSVSNRPVQLSEIGEGRLTLIDFTAYTSSYSPGHNRQLAELYGRYHSKGLEIYQISLDADSHFWKNAAVNIPWYCVRDPESIYSPVVQRYNVINIPTTFVRDGNGELVARVEDYSTLNAVVAKYMK
jgi:hypothetical protein